MVKRKFSRIKPDASYDLSELVESLPYSRDYYRRLIRTGQLKAFRVNGRGKWFVRGKDWEEFKNGIVSVNVTFPEQNPAEVRRSPQLFDAKNKTAENKKKNKGLKLYG